MQINENVTGCRKINSYFFGKKYVNIPISQKREDTVLSRSEEGFGSNCTQMPMNGRGAPAATAGSGIKLALKNLRPIFFLCEKRKRRESSPGPDRQGVFMMGRNSARHCQVLRPYGVFASQKQLQQTTVICNLHSNRSPSVWKLQLLHLPKLGGQEKGLHSLGTPLLCLGP